MGDGTNDTDNVNISTHTYICLFVHVFIHTHVSMTCYSMYVALNPSAPLQVIPLSLPDLHEFPCCSFLAETKQPPVKLS